MPKVRRISKKAKDSIRRSLYKENYMYTNPRGNGTRRKTTDDRWVVISSEGLCECGWDKRNNGLSCVISINDWCDHCEERNFSICCGNKVHKCPVCETQV